MSERKKMILFSKQLKFGEKCWKINLFSKEWARLIMHLLVPLALFGYSVDALIFMHMWYVFFLYRKYVAHKKEMRFGGGRFKVINSTVYLHLLKLFSSGFNKLFVIYYEEYLLKKINFSRGSDLKPLILQLHL